MQQVINLLSLIHKSIILLLLISLSILPLYAELDVITAFVYLPILFILFSILSIYIENILTRCHKITVANKTRLFNKVSKCPLIKEFCCHC